MKSHRFPRRVALLILLATGLLLFTGPGLYAQNPWKGSCEIKFSGTSTLHDFTGTVSAEPFTVSVTGIADPATAQLAGVVKVKAVDMDTAKPKRDKKMRDSMDVTTHTDITVTLLKGLNTTLTKPVTESGQPRPTQIPFTLTLLGKDQQKVGTVSDWKYSDGVASFKVSFSVSLKTSGIKVPAVLGFVRVGDEIKVEANLVLLSPQAVAAGKTAASAKTATANQ
jgi:hypothetical protein